MPSFRINTNLWIGIALAGGLVQIVYKNFKYRWKNYRNGSNKIFMCVKIIEPQVFAT
jgi:hypothetical protein